MASETVAMPQATAKAGDWGDNMAKHGEIGIIAKRGEKAIQFGLGKPFSSPDCPYLLIRIGGLMSLLPPPPARLLDLGCGMGWTSIFFAQRGYDVVGVDIAPDKIHYANLRKATAQLSNIHFAVSDYESLPYRNEFDIVVFYSSLHHAIDEVLTMRMAFEALRPGGVCITSEPGAGHSQQPGAQQAMQLYDVTEKDMPPSRIRQLGMSVGFRQCAIHPDPRQVWQPVLRDQPGRWQSLIERSSWLYYLRSAWRVMRRLRALEASEGFVLLTK